MHNPRNTAPLVSVIVAAYNQSEYISEALESALDQSYQNMEIIVVDDGSTDTTTNIISEQFHSHVKYYRQARNGIASARNLGISKANGRFLAFLDADDIWLSDKIETQVAKLISNPEYDMVFGHILHFYAPDYPDINKDKLKCPNMALPGFTATTLLIKSEKFHVAGAFEDDYQLGEFINWYLKSQELGLKSHLLNKTVAFRRVREDQRNVQEQLNFKHYAQIIKLVRDAHVDHKIKLHREKIHTG